MPKKEVDIEIPAQSEAKISEKLSTLSWLFHHAGQIAKGSAALLGLAALGGIGYLARDALFGGKKANGFSAVAQEDNGSNRALTKYEGKKSLRVLTKV